MGNIHCVLVCGVLLKSCVVAKSPFRCDEEEQKTSFACAGKDSPFVVHRPIRAKIIAYSTSKNQINTVKINKLYEPRVAKIEILTY